MKKISANNKCRRIRAWFHEIVNSRMGLGAQWVQTHIANCPKCQRRLASFGKVSVALSVIKSQPHNLDLLMRANAQAIGVLKHSLRYAPKAQKLKVILPEPGSWERYRKYRYSVINTAACIVIVLLMKIGIFSSMDKFQAEGRKAMKQYYASRVGEEMTDEIFTA